MITLMIRTLLAGIAGIAAIIGGALHVIDGDYVRAAITFIIFYIISSIISLSPEDQKALDDFFNNNSN